MGFIHIYAQSFVLAAVDFNERLKEVIIRNIMDPSRWKVLISGPNNDFKEK